MLIGFIRLVLFLVSVIITILKDSERKNENGPTLKAKSLKMEIYQTKWAFKQQHT